jgi:HSP20 family protein
METTLSTKPQRRMRALTPFWGTPTDRFFRNDFLDLLDGDEFIETVPSLNIREEKNNYILDLAAPGLKREDFDINVEGDRLTISSDKETETEEKEKEGFTRREYSYSSFSRTITLPDFADTSKINAKYNNGILNVTIPKKPEAQKVTSQKIKVQ